MSANRWRRVPAAGGRAAVAVLGHVFVQVAGLLTRALGLAEEQVERGVFVAGWCRAASGSSVGAWWNSPGGGC